MTRLALILDPLRMSPDASLVMVWLIALAIAAISIYVYARQMRARRAPTRLSSFAEFKSETVVAGDISFRYHRSGRGPHLLLLHGIGANLYCWRFLVPLLAHRFTITAIDLPGFGQSGHPPNAGYGLDDQTARIITLLDTLKIKRTHVVGNSMGGNLSLWLALKYPARIDRCAVIAPATSRKLIRVPLSRWTILAKPAALLLSRQAMAWAHRRTVSKKTLVDLERVEETFKTYGGQDNAVKSFMLATEAIRDPRLPKQLKNIRTKVLVLWGSADLLVSRAVIAELEKTLPQSESYVHLGGGHHLQEDEPDWVAEKLISFLVG